MWNADEPIRRFDWQPGTLVIPPDRTFHQHFNIGASPARYLALRFSGNEESKSSERNLVSSRSVRLGGDQIEYEDQEPAIHRMFVEDASRHGVDVKMEQFVAAAAG
jgi:hypothetical protein